MTPEEKKVLFQALDRLWGGLEAASQVCEVVLDQHDGRLECLREAVRQSQDSLLRLQELFGLEK